jgi:uncharacterized protein
MRRVQATEPRGLSDHIVGVISDTHGLVRTAALGALAGAELIVHAGDVGAPAVLEQLRTVAPVVAVRGNNDRGPWAHALPSAEVVEFGGVLLYVLHDVKELDLDPRAAGFRVVIAGHSHRPAVEERDGVLFLNPGSAGPRRFTLPITVARLRLRADALDATIVPLEEEKRSR